MTRLEDAALAEVDLAVDLVAKARVLSGQHP